MPLVQVHVYFRSFWKAVLAQHLHDRFLEGSENYRSAVVVVEGSAAEDPAGVELGVTPLG